MARSASIQKSYGGLTVGATGIYMGAEDQAANQNFTGSNGIETVLGLPMAIKRQHYSWLTAYPTSFESGVIAQNSPKRIPMVCQAGYGNFPVASTSQTIGGTTYHGMDIITAGAWDSFFTTRFTQLKNLGVPVLYNLFFEMNGAHNNYFPGNQGGCGGAKFTRGLGETRFVNAWRHLWTLADNVGATLRSGGNVIFVFCDQQGTSSPMYWENAYPGDQYVDWGGHDLYRHTVLKGMDSATEDTGFGDAQRIAFWGGTMSGSSAVGRAATPMPIIICEGGYGEGVTYSDSTGGYTKGTTTPANNIVDHVYSEMVNTYQDIVAYVLWNESGLTDNHVNTSPGSTAAYKRFYGHSIFFGGTTNASPSFTTAATVSDTTPQQGETLTVDYAVGGFPVPTVTYQWYRDTTGTAISGATSQSYTAVAADVGHGLLCRVTATNNYGGSAHTATSTTTATSAVIATGGTVPGNTSPPTIDNLAPTVGDLLTLNLGNWSNGPMVSYSVAWKRTIGGVTTTIVTNTITSTATSGVTDTYQTVSADQGATIKATVTATNAAGPSSGVTSGATQAVAKAPNTGTGYAFYMGADTGSGYTNLGDVDTLNSGRVFAGGDTWGICMSDDYGATWYPCMKGTSVNNSPYARAAKFSKNPNTSGRCYVGIGGMHPTNSPAGIGGGFLGVIDKGDDACVACDTAFGFATNISGGAGLTPRPLGNLIETDYDGATTEYVYSASPLGLVRYTCANGALPSSGNRTVLWSVTQQFKALCLVNQNTLLLARYNNDANGNAQAVVVYLINPANLRTAATVTANAIAGTPTNVYDIRLIGGSVFAACGDGVYKVTGAGFATWTKVSGTLADSIVTTLDGAGSVFVFAQGNSGTTLPAGHSVARAATLNPASAADFTWTTNSGNVSFVDIGTGQVWWLTTKSGYTGYIGGGGHDSSIIRIDPSNPNHVYVFGRGGVWTSQDGGLHWAPAMNGLNGGTCSGIALGGGSVWAQNTDWTSCKSAFHMDPKQPASQDNTPPAFTFNSLTATATVNGVSHTVKVDPTKTPADITLDNVSIADNYFKGACRNPTAVAMDADGFIYLTMSAGGTLVGDPGGAPVSNIPATPSIDAASKPPNGTTSTSASLTWTPQGNVAADHYRFRLTTDATVGAWQITTARSVTISTPAGHTYKFEVEAGNASNQYSAADAYTWTVNTVATIAAPVLGTTPTVASGDQTGSTSAAFTWSEANADATYRYFCKVDTPAGPGTYPVQGQVETLFNVPGVPLAPGTYKFYVKAVNGAGLASAETIWTWSVVAVASGPKAPILVQVPGDPSPDSAPVFQWTES